MARREGSDAVSLFDFFAETPRKRRPSSQIDFFPIYADFGPAKQEFHIGLGSSATPGMVPGIFAMHEALCRLPMKRLVEPAIRAARGGSRSQRSRLISSPSSPRSSTRPPALPRSSRPGARCSRPARPSASPISRRQSNGWRTARGSSSTVMSVRPSSPGGEKHDGGGYLTYDDLAEYRVARRAPILWQHDGATVALDPPPSSDRCAANSRHHFNRSRWRPARRAAPRRRGHDHRRAGKHRSHDGARAGRRSRAVR